ncbi:MAG: MBG domain-containing protein, partial [Pseudomonadota bacterium]
MADGSITIDRAGSLTTINQGTQRGIINWQSFDVGASETVRFVQPGSSSVTVNRIRDTKASQIDGRLEANGNIVLINQNGITFGSTARVDVNGIVASTADFNNDADFMNGGNLRLDQAGIQNAKILNKGQISAKEAGLIGLVAPQVENQGTINARLGRVQVASASTATLDLHGDGLIQIGLSDNESKQLVKNTGHITADGGIITISAAQARQQVDNLMDLQGYIQANSVSATQTGKIILRNTSGTIQSTAQISAKGSTTVNGGEIAIEGKFVALGGVINADGKNGGKITVNAQTASLADVIQANGLAGDGGIITVNATQNMWQTSTSKITATGTRHGGRIFAAAAHNLVSSGTYTARGLGGEGGKIDITGGGVKLLSATVNANGKLKGGQIRIGGEFQGGKNLPIDEMPNAEIVTLDRGTRVKADGEDEDSAGGTVIVWSDVDTMVLGTISAKPGTRSGLGGFVELSSAGKLNYGATVTTGSGNRAGTVLLDPKNIIIADHTYSSTAIILGRGYTGANTVNVPTSDNQQFGQYGVSLDGNRMAVGMAYNNGFADNVGRSGAVYMYSFTDASFSGAVLEGIIGNGYTGGKNINLSQLEANDQFGYDVSLDGNRLAVSAYGDDGALNARTDGGAAYLFSFTDSTFSGGALEATIGYNYTGGKNLNTSAYVEGGDSFGTSLSLNGNRLVVGAQNASGLSNAAFASGEVSMFTFTDAAFSGGVFQGLIGRNYTGGKNINVSTLAGADYFGSDVSLDGNRLVVLARGGDGNANAALQSGDVYLFSFTDAAFTGGVLEATFGVGYTGGKNISMLALETNDSLSSVSLDGNRLAIGSYADDGAGNAVTDTGAVYLYSFTDAAFSGAVLEARIGYNYSGGKNLSVPTQAGPGDYFGWSLSLDGNRLVVGAPADDGVDGFNTNQGAYHFFTFTDAAFSGGTYQGTMGTGYTGGKNINLPFNTSPDGQSERMGISLSGTRVAIGVPYDDGFDNRTGDAGAVFLYNFADTSFSSATLEGIIGKGYTGGKNINMSQLEGFDLFGASVSLDGNRLAVGTPQGDGLANGLPTGGEVYLFSFTDAAFSGGVLQSTIGFNYTGGKNLHIANLGSSDSFGSSVSLSGNRLAVGALRDDGLANNRSDAGAVYLISFADSTFSTPTLRGIIGWGYTGVGSYDLTNLTAADNMGDFNGVSLDGNRLAITAYQGDGMTNVRPGSGDVYLFTFSNDTFSTPTLQATLGFGYTGGKNIDMSFLANNDNIAGIALDGDYLAIGAMREDGSTGALSDSGTVYIYKFTDLAFSGGTLYATVGHNYTGGNNLNTATIADTIDYFGAALSMDNGNLLIGVPGLDGPGNLYSASTGAVLYRVSSTAVSEGATYANLPTGTVTLSALQLANLLSTPQNVILQASNDITVNSNILVNNVNGNGGTLTLQAGRSILLNANIDTDNGNLNLYANEDLATGVIDAQRDAGAAAITMANGTFINAGTGNVTIRLGTGIGKTNSTAGDISLRNVTGGTVLAHSMATNSDVIANGIINASAAGNALTIAAGRNFINNQGAGAFVTAAGRWLIYADHQSLSTLNGLSPAFSLSGCIYGGSCPVIPASGNGFLNQYYVITVGLNISRHYGTANPTLAAMQAAYSYSGFVDGDTAAVLDAMPTASIAGTATATANAGTSHVITITGGSDDKYLITVPVQGTLIITAKPVTATLLTPVTRMYGNANPAFNAGSFSYSGFENGDTSAVITGFSSDIGLYTAATGVGSYALNPAFTSTNYAITSAPVNLVISKRDITAAWTASLTRAYGNANPIVNTNNFTYTGLVNGDTNAVITATADFGTTDVTTNIGSYVVNSAFNAANYNITNTPTTMLDITKRGITAVWNAPLSRAYGDANPTVNTNNFTYTGLVNGNTNADILATGIFGTDQLTHAGSYTVNAAFLADNYTVTNSPTTTLTITKRDITANVGNRSRAYGDANPTYSVADVTFNNLVNGNTGSDIGAFTLGSATATATSNAGTTHAIVLSGFNDTN